MRYATGYPSTTQRLAHTSWLGVVGLVALTVSASLFAQTLPDPTRFEDAIRSFEAQDRSHPPPRGAIVLTGSSSIARWNGQAPRALAPLTVVPRGFGGSVMNDVLYYLDRVALAYEPRAILIYEGDNDTGAGTPIPNEVVLAQLEEIIANVHAASPETRIYVLSVKPSILRWGVWTVAQALNEGYQEIAARDPLVHYIDVATPLLNEDGSVMTDIFIEDGLHLNDRGNAIWGATIKAGLMPIEAQYESSAGGDPRRRP